MLHPCPERLTFVRLTLFDGQTMGIPNELAEYKQWILWPKTEKNGRVKKNQFLRGPEK